MLPRVNRLTLKIDFQKVLKNKTFIHSQYFTAAYLKESLPAVRIGIIVANKVSKKATERNRIKRVVREAVHKNLNNLSQNLKLVVLTKPTAAEVDNKILSQDVERMLKKIR